MLKLSDYSKVVGEDIVDEIRRDATPLQGKHIIHVNSTYYGGGVAEMLSTLVPLFNNLGIKTGWRIIKGNPDFFTITKKFHNALQGDSINLSKIKKKIYEEVVETNAVFTHIQGHDLIVVHDPQPLPLILHYEKTHPWVWRCHVDLSNPNKELWSYLSDFIVRYDRSIVSRESFKHNLPVEQIVIHPSIDPLSAKNKHISQKEIDKYLKKFDIPQDKPIISQISRYDKWKDPMGVVKAFQLIRKQHDCRLVLLGSMATDDPEGQEIYDEVIHFTKDMEDIHVINFENDILVNALQRASSVVIQKSLKEGFGLTVSEALWKKTPVVASNVGGIPLQIEDGKNGFLVDSIESCAEATVRLLNDTEHAKQLGEAGHKTVKEKFLITRHLHDYIKLFRKLIV